MADRIDDALEIARLAALSPLDYERARKAAAELLGIARLAVLDRWWRRPAARPASPLPGRAGC
jgi:hypothetical protein